MRVNIKPLSVNDAWKGRRYKTDEYEDYETELFLKLKKIELPEYPLAVKFEFGISSKAGDIDNPVKPFLDILQKAYGFNDKEIYRMEVIKKIVPKGGEYADFEFFHFST